MKELITELENEIKKANKKITLKNIKLNTNIYTTKNNYYEDLVNLSRAFNKLFNNSNNTNILNCYITDNENIFSKASICLNKKTLISTEGINNFNEATHNTSLAKCSDDYNYYIMRCYEYFIYLFDKVNKRCYMIIKNNKKALTMINILLLTPYLMYGELYAVHGGLVNKNSINILINNSSLGGKTTFAILFANNGWDIITEETTYIKKTGEILSYNIRNYFNIRVGTYLNFKDYFKKKGIVINKFLNLKEKSALELFEEGKKDQESIDFSTIGTFKELEKKTISTSLKVSIQKNQKFLITKCSSSENVNSFLDLSLAPTVLLFKELLNYNNINKIERKKQLEKIFANTDSYKIVSGFDYRERFSEIIKTISKKNIH